MSQPEFPDSPQKPAPETSAAQAPETPSSQPEPAPASPEPAPAPAEPAVDSAAAGEAQVPAAPEPEAPAGAPEEAPEEAMEEATAEESSFGDILSEFEEAQQSEGGGVEGTVVSVTDDAIFIDIGRKTDGVLPPDSELTVQPGDKLLVSIRGRDAEGNYLLSTVKVETPRDWSGLEAAFEHKSTIAGRVTEVVKGGLLVDVGVRAFMPASRSGVRELADLEKLVGQEIECRVTKLDTAKEDVVVDRRVVLEEQERQVRDEAFQRLEEGSVVRGTVRSITDFGAFVDVGGIDGLLHVSDMSYARGVKPSEVVKEGEELDVKILKINRDNRKISLGLKQLAPDPWSVAVEKYPVESRVQGKVVRIADFGAFVELEPGLDGLIHVSEMSWTKRNVRPGDIVKTGEMVEVVVLGVDPVKKRIALGLKQALGDPWQDALKKYQVGTVVEAPVTNLAKFGAFVDLGDGIEGMIHIGDITAERRLNHPSEVLKEGETVKAKVIEADKGRRRMRLSMKQLEPTSADEYIAEHNAGDVVTGRVVKVSGSQIKVDLGEGVTAFAPVPAQAPEESSNAGKADLSALTAMLAEKWKTGGGAEAEGESIRSGQVRSFKIVNLDAESKKIEIELAQ